MARNAANSVANIGGFFGPTILGRYGLWSMAAILCLGAVLVVGLQKKTAENDSEHGAEKDAPIAV